MFSEKTQLSKFYGFFRPVLRPPKKGDSSRDIVPTVKSAAKVMVRRAI